MADVTEILTKAKDVISLVKNEYQKLQEVERLKMKYLPIYINIIDAMERCISSFISAENYNILNHHNLSFLIIHIIQLEMEEIKDRMEVINKYNRSTRCQCCMNIVKETGRPSYIKKILDLNFKKIYENLIALQGLEERVFGTSNRIKHPILKKAWLLSGVNQMNNSSIDSTMLQNNIYELLNKEIGQKIDMDNNWNKKIINLVNELDNTINGDNILTITELNKIDKKLYGCKNVQELLMAIDQNVGNVSNDEEEEIIKKEVVKTLIEEIDTCFEGEVKLVGSMYNGDTKNRLKKFEGGESNFPYKVVCKFKVPELRKEGYELLTMELMICADDQGWGGTGHVQVRYAVNDQVSIKAFNVDRNDREIKNNTHKVIINSDGINEDDEITIYLLCPVWAGWSSKVLSVGGRALYHYMD